MNRVIVIENFQAPELDIFSRLNERQLRTLYEPEPGIFIAESPKVILRALKAGYEPLSLLVEQGELEKAPDGPNSMENENTAAVLKCCPDIPVYTAPYEVLKKLTGFALTRGLLCGMRRKAMPAPEQICMGTRRIAVLEEVENPTNLGAIFRSAAALGVDGILLTHGCTDPLYRRAARVSMGTVFQIPWTFIPEENWPDGTLNALKKQGFATAAMALQKKSVPIDDPGLMAEKKLAIILGTEGDGLSTKTIEGCDYTVRIPMAPQVDSLNVAAAAAVAFWQLSV